MYRSAWHAGLKTTYYLRSLGASGVDKATLKREEGSPRPPPAKTKAEDRHFATVLATAPFATHRGFESPLRPQTSVLKPSSFKEDLHSGRETRLLHRSHEKW